MHVYPIDDNGRICITLSERDAFVVTSKEADLLISLVSQVRHEQRNAIYGVVYAVIAHREGQLVNAAYYAVIRRRGDDIELLRTTTRKDMDNTKALAQREYGKEVKFDTMKVDEVSRSVAEREQLLYLARKLAAERGMTLSELLKEAHELKKE